MKIEYIQKCKCGAVTISFDNGASNSMFWETFEKLDLDAGDATWLHQSCCCNHCVNHWGIDLCECGSGARDGEYIPSLGQLNLMAHYMDELNKAFTYVSASPLSSTWYWSSTESSQAVAWYVVFSSGLTGTGNKHIGDMVRAVIDF